MGRRLSRPLFFLEVWCTQQDSNRITEILNGRRAITGDTALRLGHFFGTSAEFWLKA